MGERGGGWIQAQACAVGHLFNPVSFTEAGGVRTSAEQVLKVSLCSSAHHFNE